MPLFPISEYWWFYIAFTALIVALLAVDLGVFHRRAHVVGFREAGCWTAVWMSLALLFCYGLYAFTASRMGDAAARKASIEFLTGYVIEQSLSLDNMFVFVLIFAYFGVPLALQHRILFYGILGALLFRGMFISLGAVLLRFEWVLIAFGVFLIATGVKMMAAEGGQRLEENRLIGWLRKALPLTPALHGQRFFVRAQGVWKATPLFLTLAFVEVTDVMFAIDSVPAVFAVTREPLIVFTSNVFAILGLRSLYFLLAGAVVRFHMLRYAVAAILVFVGLKVSVIHVFWERELPAAVSLAVIGALLAAGILLSIIFPKEAPAGESLQEARDDAGKAA